MERFRELLGQFDWPKVARVFLPPVAVLALLYGAYSLMTRWTLEVEGRYSLRGGRPAGLSLCFFIDGRQIFPEARRTQLKPGHYSTQLVFHQWKRPETVRGRLRMNGFQEITHRPVRFPAKGSKAAVELPAMTLQKKGKSPEDGKKPW